MDMDIIKSKIIEVATKIWISPETIKAMESDMAKKIETPKEEWESVTVVVAKKEDWEELTSEQIDKMSEQEAKDLLKKEVWCEDKKEKTDISEKKPSIADRLMDSKYM